MIRFHVAVKGRVKIVTGSFYIMIMPMVGINQIQIPLLPYIVQADLITN